MCGIAGIYYLDGRKLTIEQIKSMTDSIAHRGPDGEGIWLGASGSLGLGHRRLSIIDLSQNGAQPMHYLDRYTITFNGEIYNYLELRRTLESRGYKFHSSTDTEVILALYDLNKEKFLDDLDGMFSFAIWDEKEKTLFCARDRFGEKPFFYSYNQGKEFVFASEMKALFSYGIKRDISDEMTINYLAYSDVTNADFPEKTFYNGIFRLPHAHYLKIAQNGSVSIKKYWDISPVQSNNLSIDQATDRFRELLVDSVRLRLRSDVSVGSCLSGGVDSSVVVSIINELLNKEGQPHKQKTFSVVFPGYKLDEEKYIRLLEKEKKLDAIYTTPDKYFFQKNIEKIFYHQEEPFPSSSIVAQYSVMELARKNDTIVLLDGQGADEILAGYHWYYRIFLQEQLKKGVRFYKKEIQNSIVNQKTDLKFYLNTYFPEQYSRMSRIRFLKKISSGRYSEVINSLASSSSGLRFISEDYLMAHKDKLRYRETYPPDLNNVLYKDAMQNWLQSLLRFADRNSMAFSREVRLPFLSHKLVEFVFSLDPTFKIHHGWSKYILRSAFQDQVPSQIIWRKDKIGFAAPQEDWIMNYEADVLMKKGDIKHIFNEDAQKSSDGIWQMLMISQMQKFKL